MKKLGLLAGMIAMLFLCVPSGHSQNVKAYDVSLSMDFPRLNNYLELSPYQIAEVSQINSYFIEQQKVYLNSKSIHVKQKEYHRVLYSNLKLMKETLTTEQYKKYLMLINLTLSNRIVSSQADSEIHLALQKL